MASRRKTSSGPSVIRRERGIRAPLIFAVIAMGAIAWAASRWFSAGNDTPPPPAPAPERVTADTETEPGSKEASEAPRLRAEAKDESLPQKLLEEANKALPAPAPRKQEAKQRPAPLAPADAAKEAAPLSPPPAPRPVKREAPVVAKRSLAELREAAEAGEAEGQYQLGRAYLTGAGAKTDPIEAVAWFILAAARGHALARDERDKHLAAFEPNDRIAAAYRAKALGPIIPAGWSTDPDSGTAVWLPSWFRNGVFKLELDVPAAEGVAEGEGKMVLTAGLRGYFDDRTFEGRFSRGYFFGRQVMAQPFEMLPTNAYLVRLPDSGTGAFKGTAFWVQNEFRVAIAIHLCDKRSRLLAVVPDRFKVLDDAAVNAVIGEAARIYAGLCPTAEFADVTVLPAAHQRVIDRGYTVFEPKLAEASVEGIGTQAFKILHFENHAAIAHRREVREQERLSEIEAMRQKRLRNKAAAEARAMPDVRGLRLGMTLQQVRTLFADEIAEWKPPWNPKRKFHPYAQFSQSIRLEDGAKFNATFTSPVNGSELFRFGYEQTLPNGPSVDSLTADLVAKYGEPDEVNWRGNVWTYHLVSQRPERVAAGAFMRLSYLPHGSDGSAAVTHFSIGIYDYGLGGGDESDAYQARLAAESAARKAQQEKEKSDKVKF
jgi:hypothetical protein